MPDAQMISLKDAVNLFDEDMSRSTHFDISITGPQGFQHGKKNHIFSFDIPTLNLTSEEVTDPSRERSIGVYYKVNEFKVDYLIDKDLNNYKDCKKWMDFIFTLKNRYLRYFTDYVGHCLISLYDVAWNETTKIILYNIYPTNITGFNLGHAKGEINKFSVTFYVEFLDIK